jgi:hypothetical protein
MPWIPSRGAAGGNLCSFAYITDLVCPIEKFVALCYEFRTDFCPVSSGFRAVLPFADIISSPPKNYR